ncbi:ferric reductase NAD binding domain-containing protein [Xylaria castorea]|nr:ferric reductase NAD binding domain-containing protein [Xylaria castorea]
MANISAKQLANERTLRILATVLSSFIGLVILCYWIRVLYIRARGSRSYSQLTSSFVLVSRFIRWSRYIRRFLINRRAGFPSTGHALVVLAYIAVNVILIFTNLDYSKLNFYAARAGWMASGNFALLVFLALKNTPLAALIAYPYNSLNYFHQIAGYLTIGLVLLHAALYVPYFVVVKHEPEALVETKNIMGIVAGSAMFLILLSVYLKRIHYELFYVAHVVLFLVSLIMFGLHRPQWIKRIPIIAAFVGGLWFSDRLLRGARLLRHLLNNDATLSALSGIDGGGKGGTRVLLKKPLAYATPGSHCFLWVPGVRTFETHPFTIVSNGPKGLELVAWAEDGFTQSLLQMAQAGASGIWAAAEGPYGSFPDITNYDKVVLIAGGSGATFAFGTALNALERRSAGVGAVEQQREQDISLIWATRRIEDTEWFADHTKTLVASHNPRVSLTYYITSALAVSWESDLSDSIRTTGHLSEVSISRSAPFGRQEEAISNESGLSCKAKDEEKIVVTTVDGTTRGTCAIPSHAVVGGLSPVLKYEKPNLEEVILEAVKSVDNDQRVLVASCGPDRMTKDVRNIVAQSMTADGPSITLHCESFAW